MVTENPPAPAGHVVASRWRGTEPALWLLIAILAWVQFPLGSARPWAWDILVLLVAVNWLLWLRAAAMQTDMTLAALRPIALPGLLMLGVMVWIFVQCASWTPGAWHHAVWQLPSEALGIHQPGAISLNPYVSATEAMKLLSYLAVGLLTYFLALRHDYAHRLFVAIFCVGVVYSLYGILLSALGTSQITLFEGLAPPYRRAVSGGLVAKNSFATFTGLALLPGIALFVANGQRRVVTEQGIRVHARTLLQYVMGEGGPYFAGIIVMIGALIASNSRAGFLSALIGLFAMLVVSAILSARRKRAKWTLMGGAAAAALVLVLFMLSGHNLESRFAGLVETTSLDDLRADMWDAAMRAIADNPLLGSGLGTFGSVYHLYADKFVPYVVDRVHNDYLEFVMGVGAPAAAAWMLALLILTVRCVRGVFQRRRRRLYAMTAVGGVVLVGFHSIFDFSLQMPAVAIVFAMLLGLGVAQSRRSGEEEAESGS